MLRVAAARDRRVAERAVVDAVRHRVRLSGGGRHVQPDGEWAAGGGKRQRPIAVAGPQRWRAARLRDQHARPLVLADPVGGRDAAHVAGVLAPAVAGHTDAEHRADVAVLARRHEVARPDDVVLAALQAVDHPVDRDHRGDPILHAPALRAHAAGPGVRRNLERRARSGRVSSAGTNGSSGLARSVHLAESAPGSICSKPTTRTHSAMPPAIACAPSMRAELPVEQLLLTLNTGMPVRPSWKIARWPDRKSTR